MDHREFLELGPHLAQRRIGFGRLVGVANVEVDQVPVAEVGLRRLAEADADVGALAVGVLEALDVVDRGLRPAGLGRGLGLGAEDVEGGARLDQRDAGSQHAFACKCRGQFHRNLRLDDYEWG